MSIKAVLLALAGVFAAAAPALPNGEWQVGPHLIVAVPQEDFENVSGAGVGLGFRVRYGRSRAFGLRGDAAFLSFGKSRAPLGIDPNSGVIVAEFDTQGWRASIGPQLTRGGVSYSISAHLQGGLHYFRKSVTIPTSTSVFTDTVDNNLSLGWNGGFGTAFDVGLGPWIDLGVEFFRMYGLPGPLIDDPEDPKGSRVNGPDLDVNEVAFKVGVIFFLEPEQTRSRSR